MTGPTREFWEQRFVAHDTPWDRGGPNPQLDAWLRDRVLAPCRILVPGCGAGHEVLALARAGFAVTGLDYSPAALALVREKLRAAGAAASLIEADALCWQPPDRFDAIYEQTCLCALHPDHWRSYADQVAAWLRPGGRLFALFMQAPRAGASDGCIEGPPYHCDVNAMRSLFAAPRWIWPAPPYPRVPHPVGYTELAVVLERGAPG